MPHDCEPWKATGCQCLQVGRGCRHVAQEVACGNVHLSQTQATLEWRCYSAAAGRQPLSGREDFGQLFGKVLRRLAGSHVLRPRIGHALCQISVAEPWQKGMKSVLQNIAAMMPNPCCTQLPAWMSSLCCTTLAARMTNEGDRFEGCSRQQTNASLANVKLLVRPAMCTRKQMHTLWICLRHKGRNIRFVLPLEMLGKACASARNGR